MNYMAEGLISFLSAPRTLGEDRRLMCCRDLTLCCLFGGCVLGSAERHRHKCSLGSAPNMQLNLLSSTPGSLPVFLILVMFKEAVKQKICQPSRPVYLL